jgi:hypothetical protein
VAAISSASSWGPRSLDAPEFRRPATPDPRLAGACEVKVCLAARWIEDAGGRLLGEADRASVREIAATFAASGESLRELAVAVATSEAFLAP